MRKYICHDVQPTTSETTISEATGGFVFYAKAIIVKLKSAHSDQNKITLGSNKRLRIKKGEVITPNLSQFINDPWVVRLMQSDS